MLGRSTAFVFATVLAALHCGCDDDGTAPAPAPEDRIETTTVLSSRFIPYRFFRLDQPDLEPAGRIPEQERIDFNSIRVYRGLPLDAVAGPADIAHMAAYEDTAGCHAWDSAVDFTRPYLSAPAWRELSIDLVVDFAGRLRWIDLGEAEDVGGVLGVCYRVVDRNGRPVVQVGDDPGLGPPTQAIVGGDGELFHRLKLLKAPMPGTAEHAAGLEVRSVYALGGANLDPATLAVRIEVAADRPEPERDETGMPYLRIFGLDSEDARGQAGADGFADIHDQARFDLERGLLVFPDTFAEPFAASPAQYAANTRDAAWDFPSSLYLAANLVPALYVPLTPRDDLDDSGRFRIVVEKRFPMAR